MRRLLILCAVAVLAGCASPRGNPDPTGTTPRRSYYGGDPLDVPPPVFAGDPSKKISVRVGGEVVHGGTYAMAAGSPVSEAIRQAGGFTQFAHQKILVLRRGGLGAGGKSYRVNMRQAREDRRYDLVLEEGDQVFVPRTQPLR